MKLQHFLSLIAATPIGIGTFTLSAPAQEQIPACPDPSTLTSVATPGDATSFESVTGGNCSGTPSSYGVTIYKMGFCTANPSPSAGAVDYSSCSITYEDSSGTPADFGPGGPKVKLDKGLSKRVDKGTYGYALVLLSNTFKIKADYGPIAGNTYYSTSTSTGWPAQGNTVGPATANPVSAQSLGQNCDSADTISVKAGTLTGTLLNSSGERIPENSSVESCSGVQYILGVVSLSSPVTIKESANTDLEAIFTVTNSGTTLSIDNRPGGVAGIIFDVGPFNMSVNVREGSTNN